MSGAGPDEVRFIADAMLGRLATWMRIIGCDVEYERDIDDAALVIRALTEGRVILTRDRLLTRRRGVRGRTVFIESDRLFDQLRQAVMAFGISRKQLFTRCIRCNTVLKSVEKAEVEGLVPEYVYQTQGRFSRCPSCRRVYWAGTHRGHVERALGRVFGVA